MNRLEDRIAVITGGATGIGGATAEQYAAEGAIVHILDANVEDGQATQARIRDEGGQARFHELDIRDADQVRATFERIGTTDEQVDILVCSAGVLRGAYAGIEDLAEDDWDATLDTNLKGTYLTTRFAAPLLRQADKSVVLLIASGAGVHGGSSSYAYAASKAGVHGMRYNLENDLGPSGSRIHVVCPGGIATPLKLKNVAEGAQSRGEDVEAAVVGARQSLGDPKGVAHVLTFLASTEGEYVRGTIFTR
jgi:NAD(P)-dependent dehydrogenase (short-subunit alcohol dehydrogenase family)